MARMKGNVLHPPTNETALGALLDYVTHSPVKPFVPSHVNFGIISGWEEKKRITKKRKRELICDRALRVMREWVQVL